MENEIQPSANPFDFERVFDLESALMYHQYEITLSESELVWDFSADLDFSRRVLTMLPDYSH
jgi:hypothetical protein